MKFEEVLPLMRQGKKAYLTKCHLDWWIGKERYFLEYFDSVEDFKKKYPNIKLGRLGEYPQRCFLACFMNDIYSYCEDSSNEWLSEEDTYNYYLSLKGETTKLYENGDIEFSFVSDNEIMVFDHKNKKVMTDYYRDPKKLCYDIFFYSDVLVASEWDVFE